MFLRPRRPGGTPCLQDGESLSSARRSFASFTWVPVSLRGLGVCVPSPDGGQRDTAAQVGRFLFQAAAVYFPSEL